MIKKGTFNHHVFIQSYKTPKPQNPKTPDLCKS
jgi:hypothetical protein